jgi:hypothetical protein
MLRALQDYSWPRTRLPATRAQTITYFRKCRVCRRSRKCQRPRQPLGHGYRRLWVCLSYRSTRLQNMRKIVAIAFTAIETQRGPRPVALASDVDDSIGANLISKLDPPFVDPSHDVGG